MGFCGVTYTMDIRMYGTVCTLSHFPYEGTPKHDSKEIDERFPHLRPKKKKGQMLIHGHTHKKKQYLNGMINVCVDAWGFRPAMACNVRNLVTNKGDVGK